MFVTATSFTTGVVVCPGPSSNSSSSLPQIIQLANDYRDKATFSNALTFVRTAAPRPTIVSIVPSSASQWCLQTGSCPIVNVYGTGLAGGSSYLCEFFSISRPGQYRGTVSSLPNGTHGTYDQVICPQIPAYKGATIAQGQNVTKTDGFAVWVYQQSTGYTSSNRVSWTYTA